jgi:RimJ/RimL family protein N-acetyltransferase
LTEAFVSAPTLTTSRLILRAHTRADYEALHAIWSHKEVMRFIGGRASTRQDSWFRLMRYLGHWSLMGYGYFALCERDSGRYIGDMGVANHKRGLHPDFDDAPETGWVLAPETFGKGYATEAMGAVLGWFEAVHGKGRTVCMIESLHTKSHKVALKLGYQPFTEVMVGEDAITLFQRG